MACKEQLWWADDVTKAELNWAYVILPASVRLKGVYICWGWGKLCFWDSLYIPDIVVLMLDRQTSCCFQASSIVGTSNGCRRLAAAAMEVLLQY